MLLHCTLVSAPGSSAPAGSRSSWPSNCRPDCSGADLQAAVSLRYGTGGLSVQGAPLAGLTLGVPPLVHGAVLIDGSTGSPPGPGRGAR